MDMLIRKLTKEDNKKIEEIIKECLIEFGANREGFAWADPELGYLSEAYKDPNSEYWVVEKNGEMNIIRKKILVLQIKK